MGGERWGGRESRGIMEIYSFVYDCGDGKIILCFFGYFFIIFVILGKLGINMFKIVMYVEE